MTEVEKLYQAICDNYCKYPDQYDEDSEGIPLSESEICQNCPVIYMMRVYNCYVKGREKTV